MIQEPNAWIYQIAMSFYFLSYISNNILFLRITLTCASLSILLWYVYFLPVLFMDGILWMVVSIIINVIHAIIILNNMRDVTINPELEDVYNIIFSDHFTRREFNELINGKGFIRTLKSGSCYIEQGNPSYHLSVLISGSLLVSKKSKSNKEVVLETINACHFIDSPNYLQMKMKRSSANNYTVPVTIRAITDCRYICWPIENLHEYFASPEGAVVSQRLDVLCGADVAIKLFQLDTMVSRAEPLSTKVFRSPTGIGSIRKRNFSNPDTSTIELSPLNSDKNSSTTNYNELPGQPILIVEK